MSKNDQEIMETLKLLDRYCEAIQKEDEKKSDDLSYARVCEVKNIRSALINLIKDPSFLDADNLREMVNNLTKRVRELKFNTKSAGIHNAFVDHTLLREIQSKKT